jgi:hypothetical protein
MTWLDKLLRRPGDGGAALMAAWAESERIGRAPLVDEINRLREENRRLTHRLMAEGVETPAMTVAQDTVEHPADRVHRRIDAKLGDDAPMAYLLRDRLREEAARDLPDGFRFGITRALVLCDQEINRVAVGMPERERVYRPHDVAQRIRVRLRSEAQTARDAGAQVGLEFAALLCEQVMEEHAPGSTLG